MAISALLIVRNEAATLPGCLSALHNAVNEIVVVDTGSTDDTPRIAQSHGARVFDFPWCDDFSAARNFAILQANGDCAITVDADETLANPPEEARALLARFAAMTGLALGLVEIVNLSPDDADGVSAIDHTARVFSPRQFHYVGAVHEQLVPPEGGTPTGIATGLRLRHTGYALSPAQAAAKAHRNIALLRKELDSHPDDEYFRYQLGKAWFSLGRYRAAAIAFEHALRAIDFTACPPRGRLGAVGRRVLTGATCGAAYAHINAGDPARALALLQQHHALAHEGTRAADFFHALGYALLQSGQLNESEAAYRLSLGLPEDVPGVGSWASWYHLGLIDEARHDTPSAREKYREALHLNPRYQPAHDRLAPNPE
jgi:hypothetical protein